MPKPTQTVVEPVEYEEPRGIFESIKIMFSSLADVVIHSTSMLGTTAKAGDSLARAGLVMAESNEKLVQLRTAGKEQAELARLEELYPSK